MSSLPSNAALWQNNPLLSLDGYVCVNTIPGYFIPSAALCTVQNIFSSSDQIAAREEQNYKNLPMHHFSVGGMHSLFDVGLILEALIACRPFTIITTITSYFWKVSGNGSSALQLLLQGKTKFSYESHLYSPKLEWLFSEDRAVCHLSSDLHLWAHQPGYRGKDDMEIKVALWENQKPHIHCCLSISSTRLLFFCILCKIVL